MYIGYFGLSEIPFSIAPNPKFLFMSDRHREALAHLTYGLGDTGGFVLLTGEVGTGKTTISRRLMEQLPENTQTAYILNPTLSSQELLASICDELKIRYRKTGATLKTLTDKIQEKLLKNHEKGLNTLLIIDEAQHLEAEVLEQLRLLTNLETDTKKLLQVILIGQPELKQLLQRRDLRQLAQRITARYHLMPLTRDEVKQYITHRLSIAECERVVFDNSAIKIIHQISQGIPRVINLLCERSLANAYGTNNTIVNSKLVKRSAEEALGDEYKVTSWQNNFSLNKVLVACVAVLFLGVGIGAAIWGGSYYLASQHQLVTENHSEQTASNNTIAENKVKAQETSTGIDVESGVEKNSVNHVENQANISSPNITNQKSVTEEQVLKAPVIKAKNTDSNRNVGNAQQHVVSSNNSSVETPDMKKENQLETDTKVIKKDYKVNPTQGVSEDMLARFQSAIEETKNESDEVLEDSNKYDRLNSSILSLPEMPLWVQNGVPNLQFEMHIYASDGDGWVRVNGRDRYEGDYIANDLMLERILPQQMILTYKNERFSLPAMATW